MYRTLDPSKTIETLRTLSNRIDERFPGASLTRVCRELQTIAEETCGRIRWLSRPHAGVRAGLFVLAALALLLGWHVVGRVKFHTDGLSIEELEAATNGVFLLGAALLFLLTVETRLKRRGVLSAINELRAISHVIDMHQLTKDPSQVLALSGFRTASSPARTLTPFELTRYLDYCSEMLSLVGKLAALYAQSTSDSVVLQAVNDIETLTNGISRKIWQKIMILDSDLDRTVEPGSGAVRDSPRPLSETANPRTTPDPLSVSARTASAESGEPRSGQRPLREPV